VRLKRRDPGQDGNAAQGFNTKKVRLKRQRPACPAAARNWFQYQKGAIKTFRCPACMQSAPSFNTKKVRLKRRWAEGG